MSHTRLIAVLLGIIPGLGHAYLGQKKKGAMIFAAVIGAFIAFFLLSFLAALILPNAAANLLTTILAYGPWMVYGWSMADAYNTADNAEPSAKAIRLA